MDPAVGIQAPTGSGYQATFDSLDPGLPLLLLPVRLEARFLPRAHPTELVVRIFPDDLQVDVHVEALEPGELAHGTAFWRAAWPSAVPRRRLDALFARMASRLGAQRAAWVLEATRPLNWTLRPPRDDAPRFPKPMLRASVEPGQARLLPDRWVVTGFRRDEQVFAVAGARIAEGALAAAPDFAAIDAAPTSMGELLDAQGMAWLRDLSAAETAGMAVRIPLGEWDVDEGIDLFVVGVRASADDGADAVADLLAAQHWTRGLDLLRRGVATNNSDDAPSGDSVSEPDLEPLLTTVLAGAPATTRAAGRQAPGLDLPSPQIAVPLADRPFGSALTMALGLGEETIVDRLPGADGDQLQLASAMNAALWPVTWGHFFRSLVAPAVSDTGIAWLRRRFANHVPGGGALPLLRVGRQPYGVLPVAVDRVEPATAPELQQLTTVLLTLLAAWDNAVAEWVPRLDPDATDVTGDVSGPRETVEDATTALARILGATPNPSDLALRAVTDATDEYVEHHGGGIFLLALMLSGGTSPRTEELFKQLPDAATLEEEIALFEQMVTGLPDGDPLEEFIKTYFLWGGTLGSGSGEVEVTGLLDGQVWRSSPLRDARLGVDLTQITGLIEPEGEPQVFLNTFADVTTPWTGPLTGAAGDDVGAWLAALVTEADDPGRPASVTGPAPLLFQLLQRGLAIADPADRADAVAGLKALAGAVADGTLADPAAELETLLGETLGLGMHRIDAWLAGVAVARVEAMRRSRPHGLELGGFGWLLGLRPAGAGPSQGFIHTGGLDLAATAAILRSGWSALGGGTSEGQGLAVDLSSDRVRGAQWIVDGLRDGRRLSELLGQSLERRLHDAGLSVEVAPLRALVLEAGRDGDQAPNAIVDGHLVARGWLGGDQVVTPTAKEQAVGDALRDHVDASDDEAGLRRVLNRHAADLDAVADTGLAQAVHALVRGDPAGASAAMDGLGGGDAGPAALDAFRTRRGGRRVTHRVLLLLDAADAPRSASPDALAEPVLEAWLDRALPLADVVYDAWATVDGQRARLGTRSLADAGLGKLELLADLGGTLTRRLEAALARELAETRSQVAEVRLDPDPPDAGDRLPLRLFAPAATALRSALMGGRAADTRDLDTGDLPSTADLAAVGERDVALAAGARAVADRLRAAGPTPDLLATMDAAAAWHPGTAPGTAGLRDLVTTGGDAADRAALEAAAAITLATLDARLEAHDAETDPVARIAALLPGALVLPPFTPADPTGLRASARRSEQRTGGTAAALAWLNEVGRTRERVGAAANAADLLEAAIGRGVRPVVAQLPDLPGEAWAATTMPGDGPRTCLFGLAWPDGTPDSVCGLVIDGWTEVIPDRRVTTGLAVHADAPSSRAPQSLLLAVPPAEGDWSFDEVLTVVRQTLDRARQRAAGPELIEPYGQYLPAIHLGDDADPGPQP